MLMKVKAVDYFYVAPEHEAIDRRLNNWASWVQVRQPSWVSPMFRRAISGARQWHMPEHREQCDVLDGMAMEKAVYALPEKHRNALRWCYVYKYGEDRFRRNEGLTREGLATLLRDARQMLMNRGV